MLWLVELDSRVKTSFMYKLANAVFENLGMGVVAWWRLDHISRVSGVFVHVTAHRLLLMQIITSALAFGFSASHIPCVNSIVAH